MDRKVKKIIVDIVAVALFGSYICVPLSDSGVSLDITRLFPESKVSAEDIESSTYDGFTYITKDEKVIITKYDNSKSEVVIPQTINKMPVVCIDEEAFVKCTLTSIVIPGSVEEIRFNAFYDCKSLKNITFNEGLKKLEYHSFYGTAPTEVTIPASLTSSNAPFENCNDLTSVKFAEKCTVITESLFSGCSNITEINIPDSIEVISDNAFAKCTGLSSVTIPSTVKKIGMSAFRDCINLKDLTLSEGIEKIEYHAFYAAPITEITIPASLTESNAPFENCNDLTSVKFAEKCTVITESLFSGCSNITEINIPDSIEVISDNAFAECTGLSSVTIPSTVKKIGVSAFRDCINLKEIVFNEGIESIGYHAFSGTALTEVTIPSSLTESNSPFSECFSLVHASFAEGTEKAPDNIFKNCTSLYSVTLPESVTGIGNGSFAGCTGLKTIFSPLTKINFKPTSFTDCISLYDSRFSVLDLEKCELSANADSCTVNGIVNCTLRYKVSNKFAETSDNYSVILDIPQGISVLPDSIVCGDDKCSVTETDPFTIELSKPEGKVKFSLRIQEYGNFRITGSLKFCNNYHTWKQSVGTLDVNAPDITINAPETIDVLSSDISGVAVKDSDVSIYADDRLVVTVKSNKKTGRYQATVELPEKQSGESYSLYAKCGDNISEKIQTKYTLESPVVESATLIYNKHEYVSEDITDVFTQGTSPAFYFNPAYPFVFEIKASHTDKIDKMFVSSTKGNQMKYIEALWNEESQVWIASGYFDNNNTRYVPGALNISIVEKKEEKHDRNSETENPQKFNNVSENVKKNSSVKINNKTDKSVVADIKVSDGKKSGDVTLVTENTDSTYINGSKVKASEIAKNPAKYGFVKSNVKSSDDGKTYSYYVFTPNTRDIVSEVTGIMGDAYHGIDNMCSGVTILEVLEGDKSDTFEAQICNSFITSVSKTILSDRIGDYTFGGAFSIAGDTYDFMSRLSGTDSEQLQCAAIVLYGLQAFNTFGTETALTLCGCPPIVSSVISGFISVGLGYVGEYLDECIQENKEFTLNGFIVFLIDPSGYIYEAVESNRVSDAKTTLYYLDPKTNMPVEWDAENYSQVNPLYTDLHGAYAWDVPEGKWQVKCEKDGYDTVQSEWLDVPPEQTEVNLALISHAVPEISRVDAYADFVSVKFSKYMKIDTISESSLVIRGNDKKILCKVTPQLYSDDDEFTDTFIIKPQSGKLESYDSLKIECTEDCLSYSGTATKVQSINCTLDTDIFDLSVGNAVTVLSPGMDAELIFTAKPAGLASGKKLIIKDESGIISYDNNVKFDGEGIAKIKITAQKAGTAKIYVNAEDSKKICETEIAVINSALKSGDKAANKNDYLKGDIDNNGVVNAVDLVLLKKYLLLAISENEAPYADVNGSGVVDIMDFVALVRLFLE